jgi:hypothetical protein
MLNRGRWFAQAIMLSAMCTYPFNLSLQLENIRIGESPPPLKQVA